MVRPEQILIFKGHISLERREVPEPLGLGFLVPLILTTVQQISLTIVSLDLPGAEFLWCPLMWETSRFKNKISTRGWARKRQILV